MTAPVRLREDFDGPRLRALAKRTGDDGQLRRLLAVAEIYDGRSRGAAASFFAPNLRAQEYTIEPGDVKGDEPDYAPYVDRNIPIRVLWGDTQNHTSNSPNAGLIGNTLREMRWEPIVEVTQIKGMGEIRQSVQRVRSDVIGAKQGLSIQRGPTATRPHRLAISKKDHCHIRCSHPRTSPPTTKPGTKATWRWP